MTADASLAFAFAAGMVAIANPCGFALLPAYLTWFLEDRRDQGANPAAAALAIGGAVSVGFLVAFAVAGAVIAAGLRQVLPLIPWFALVVGITVTGIGVWLLSGRHVRLPLPGVAHGPSHPGWRSAAGFGVSYGVASLSCTLPVFLTVVAAATTQPTLFGAMAVFASYAAGMSLLLVALAVTLAMGRTALLGRLRAATGRFQQIAGGLLVLAGGYVTLFWTFNLASGRDPVAAAGPIAVVESTAAAVATRISAAPALWATMLATVVAAGVAAAMLRRRRPATPKASHESTRE